MLAAPAASSEVYKIGYQKERDGIKILERIKLYALQLNL